MKFRAILTHIVFYAYNENVRTYQRCIICGLCTRIHNKHTCVYCAGVVMFYILFIHCLAVIYVYFAWNLNFWIFLIQIFRTECAAYVCIYFVYTHTNDSTPPPHRSNIAVSTFNILSKPRACTIFGSRTHAHENLL